MIKDKNSLNEIYKSYAFVEFIDIKNEKKDLEAINKGEISIRDEILSENYSTKTDDKNNNEHNYYNNNLHVVNIYFYF